MQNQDTLSRRQILARLTALTGAAISAPIAAAVLAGASASDNGETLKLLTTEQVKLITAIVDIIIPETDTPSASTAGVQHFIHMMLSDWYTVGERETVLSGLHAIDEQAHAQTSSSFIKASKTEQLTILQGFDRAAYSENDHNHFFRKIKEMTTVGYYTSEIGATQELRYEPVPGPYRGCVPFSEIGRTWAL